MVRECPVLWNSMMSSRSGSLSPSPGPRSPSESLRLYAASDDGEAEFEAEENGSRSLSSSPVPPDEELTSAPTSLEGATLHILQSTLVASEPIPSVESSGVVDLQNATPQQQETVVINDAVVDNGISKEEIETDEMVENGMLPSAMTL